MEESRSGISPIYLANTHAFVLFLFISMLVLFVFLAENATADSEPNDSFSTAESVDTGTFTGEVDPSEQDEKDHYKFKLDAKTTLRVSARLISGSYLEVTSYDEDWERHGHVIEGINLNLYSQGESKEEEWHYDGEACTIYLLVEGDGRYEISIGVTKITSTGDPETAALLSSVIVCMVAAVLVPLILLGAAIVAIVILINYFRKKKRAQQMPPMGAAPPQPTQYPQQQQQYQQPQQQNQYQQQPQQQQPPPQQQDKYPAPPAPGQQGGTYDNNYDSGQGGQGF